MLRQGLAQALKMQESAPAELVSALRAILYFVFSGQALQLVVLLRGVCFQVACVLGELLAASQDPRQHNLCVPLQYKVRECALSVWLNRRGTLRRGSGALCGHSAEVVFVFGCGPWRSREE